MSKFSKGVYAAVRKDQTIYYKASLTYKRKHISLGSFSTEETANQAYQEGLRLLEDKTLTLKDYSARAVLSFEKTVILLNFRDNGLYIATPIYIRPKFFFYYLSPEEILKFDIDDLFFYSSHKIMKRGTHLFVADYGSQINIRSRYGIPSHAVLGRDYQFTNGDELDFRYENIHIINPYHGVRQVVINGQTKYKAIIHIKGNFVVGIYASLEEAAIAYNKAADFCMKHGCGIRYTLNYIEGFSPSLYSELYTKLKISTKLVNALDNFQKQSPD